MTSFTLKRSGKFTVRTIGPHHCGTSDVLEMSYHMDAKFSIESLDKRGFLFDQTNVAKYFETQRYTTLSCERYAQHCARELYRMIRKENGKCNMTAFSLTLSPAPFAAELTFEYQAEAPKAKGAAA